VILPLPIVGVRSLIRLLFVELPHDRRRHELEICEARIALFQDHGLARDGDELTRLLACGVRPSRALKTLEYSTHPSASNLAEARRRARC
jgi:hypothetical protein